MCWTCCQCVFETDIKVMIESSIVLKMWKMPLKSHSSPSVHSDSAELSFVGSCSLKSIIRTDNPLQDLELCGGLSWGPCPEPCSLLPRSVILPERGWSWQNNTALPGGACHMFCQLSITFKTKALCHILTPLCFVFIFLYVQRLFWTCLINLLWNWISWLKSSWTCDSTIDTGLILPTILSNCAFKHPNIHKMTLLRQTSATNDR